MKLTDLNDEPRRGNESAPGTIRTYDPQIRSPSITRRTRRTCDISATCAVESASVAHRRQEQRHKAATPSCYDAALVLAAVDAARAARAARGVRR